jgi:hypothetical protein
MSTVNVTFFLALTGVKQVANETLPVSANAESSHQESLDAGVHTHTMLTHCHASITILCVPKYVFLYTSVTSPI